MSAIDVMFTRTYDGDYIADFDCNDSELPHDRNVFFYQAISAEELANLRVRVAELEEAHVYLDESPVNYPDDDEVHTLADRIAPIVGEIIEARKTIAELEDQIDQFRFLLVAHNAVDARDLGGVIDALEKWNSQLELSIEGRNLLIDSAIGRLSNNPDETLTAASIKEQETIAQQAAQLEQARKVIERCSAYIGSIDHGQNTKSYMMCDEWLSSNPAPQFEAH